MAFSLRETISQSLLQAQAPLQNYVQKVQFVAVRKLCNNLESAGN